MHFDDEKHQCNTIFEKHILSVHFELILKRMKQIQHILFYLIAAFALVACENDNCFKPAGRDTLQTTSFSKLNLIVVKGVFDIELVQDTSFYIVASGPEQVVKGVDFELLNDTLTCYHYTGCFWRSDRTRPHLQIHFSDLQALHIDESSYLYSPDTLRDNFKLTIGTKVAEADLLFSNTEVYFYIHKSSGGRYNFRGKTQKAFLMNFNTGLFDMSELECQSARVLNFSIIDMKVNVRNRLAVEIYNSGNIYYKGTPELIVDAQSSTGRALPAD